MSSDLKHIPLTEIHEPDEALRKVDRTQEAYLGLVESIRDKGVMNPINVRLLKDPETGEEMYGLVDGLQRLTASKDAGKDSIPCHVISVEDGELIEAQIIANVHKIETKPVEYSKALLKVLSENIMMTRTELAQRLHKTGAWISERLGLLKLTDDIGALVDEGKIGLSNAYALAKLPEEEQSDFVDRAMTMPPQQFAPTVNERAKEIRDAKRKGKDAGPAEFKAIPLLRSRAELVGEFENPQAGPIIIKENNIKDPVKAFAMGIRWAIQLDPAAIELQKAQDEERKAEREAAREKATIERKRKRAAEAAAKAAELQKEAEEATV